MNTLTLLPGETGTGRNVAHRGPAFFPWHRQALRELEIELQRLDPSVEIPYWPWENEGAGWRTAPIWNRVGGNGDPNQGNRITTGPFASWTSIIFDNATGSFVPRAGIIRQFRNVAMPSPTARPTRYDVSPWSESSSTTASFRAFIESAHDTVHVNIGGDMGVATSPNDPIFWLHHCNVDRLWARWQSRWGLQNYQPTAGGPPGHNIDDVMQFHLSPSVRINSTLDWRAMGYSYTPLPSTG
jgi:tyrosinase